MSSVRPDIEAPSHPLEKDFAFRNNVAQAHVSIRNGFLRKVYGILFTQLAVTALVAGAMFYVRQPLLEASAFGGLSLLSAFLAFGFLIALAFKKHETPLNYILLFGFTLLESFAVGSIVLHYSGTIVLQAVGLTALATFGLMSYTFQTKRDLSQWGSGLCVALLLLIIAGPINFFLGSSLFEFSLSIGGALLFSLLIIYDTHRIMHHCSPEDYIVACIDLYLDILNLFLYLLRILKDIQGNN
ncbi:hypothetical protein T265_03272 [Opisthorchis viverrini]|uniref:Inhibitor of apoptosis-promoting Bax1 n=1 Tax=Opisthorchis viverrini TaxID=6198 RepID=A0A074ZSC4_OPIVI|nr:hypothetical protein T265_03272 [Opisthorchis viverrini]KER30328.1 hypothetical protein T265_03272 [Opisthorchis viverrini]